ncbi:DUF4314 domain-containing protein [Actinoplanes sp. ATCC 53533]|uniref:DUF4314 domain-containing protein n=1 Tax=Actinoplanes sp. ATCC 53533 TaxID=1288362 RepID=UPI000F7A5C9C|nr:DUF4314 domain-containing protein [Actinoplanes sp. ATCC 53533]RSM65112.1 DUF4314 domain-containing protein [Actinoplanes sp. ATCC 53533]
MTYQPGQRITLVCTNDPHTRLRPGDTGTVVGHDPHQQTVYIAWDSGSTLAMCLDAGDRIAPAAVDPAADSRDDPAPPAATMLRQWYDAGAQHGRDTGDRWAHTTFARCAAADAVALAHRLLTGLDNTDDDIADLLPDMAGSGRSIFPAQADVPAEHHQAAVDAYADGYDDTVLERVAVHCRTVLAFPDQPWQMLPHLHPDQMRVGAVGVFAGSWAGRTGPLGLARVPVGFAGTLLEVGPDGRAVFACDRQVAEAIVADQQRQRDHWLRALISLGEDPDLCAAAIEQSYATVRFDGATLVIDETSLPDVPETVTRIDPDLDGRYVVMGGVWDWRPVDPQLCDRIAGDVPAPSGRHDSCR